MRAQLAIGCAVAATAIVVAVSALASPAPRAPAARDDLAPRIPVPGVDHAPSLVRIDGSARGSDSTDGAMLADVDSCASCHPDAAKQWSASAHSFASFGNPIYRENVELARRQFGTATSQHCGGCHDMPLMLDGLMTSNSPHAIAGDDLRAHSGVTCRLCHGIEKVAKDGNGSYVWRAQPIDAPDLHDAASIARHRIAASVKPLGTELCVGCHRGFISPEMGDKMPVHLTGLDESGMWRSSAWNGNGMARVDTVDKKTCIDCHMEREPASKDELGAHGGAPGSDRWTIASHRFVGGHTWMAAMRGDREQLARTQAKLEGAASIDIAGALAQDGKTLAPHWYLPAETAEVVPGRRLNLDVVIRNLLVGHRFPGGVLDIQDTWIEVEVATRDGVRLAQSGLAHARDPKDEDAHALRSIVVDENGRTLEQHEMEQMRTQVQSQTLSPREAQVVRYAFDVPATLAAAQLPLTVTARLRHRSRTLAMQAAVCATARTADGATFLHGAKATRGVTLDPCAPQPITLIAETHAQIGAGALPPATARPQWERDYEHGMALTLAVSERLEEARAVLAHALAAAPDGKPRAMVLVQLAQVASRQGRVDDALALIAKARALLPSPGPAALDAIAADALARVWRWNDAVAPAKACVQRAPGNVAAWVQLARVLGSTGDDRGALAAAVNGLALSPRDPDLLRSQATALAAMGRPEAPVALAAYDRFRSPDNSAELRIECAGDSPRCAREREQAHTHVMH